MRIIEISYQQVQNLGNYESRRVEATAVVTDSEDPAQVLADLKAFVQAGLPDPYEERRQAKAAHQATIAAAPPADETPF